MYDENRRRIDLDTNTIAGPWWPRWLAFMERAVRQRGGDVEAATFMETWIRQNDAFEEVVAEDFFMPVSPWAKGDDPDAVRSRDVGANMREDVVVGCGLVAGILCDANIFFHAGVHEVRAAFAP